MRVLSPFRFRGGTVVEVWTPNATLTKGECKYVDGNATADFAGQGFSSRPGGSLFTGMIAPFVNYAIKGAVWCESMMPLGTEMLCCVLLLLGVRRLRLLALLCSRVADCRRLFSALDHALSIRHTMILPLLLNCLIC